MSARRAKAAEWITAAIPGSEHGSTVFLRAAFPIEAASPVTCAYSGSDRILATMRGKLYCIEPASGVLLSEPLAAGSDGARDLCDKCRPAAAPDESLLFN